jgi:hypothetical protein
VPEVFRAGGFRFFFYANVGNPREPPHIHVEQGEREAKFRLSPHVHLAYNDGFDARTLRRLQELVEANRAQLQKAWNDFFG